MVGSAWIQSNVERTYGGSRDSTVKGDGMQAMEWMKDAIQERVPVPSPSEVL